jgi:zinc protease
LLSDVAMNPDFKAEAFERLRADELRRLVVADGEPGTIAWRKFRQEAYGDHPYGQLDPTSEEVEGYTLPDAIDFYGKQYGGARAHLYVVGQFNATTVGNTAREAFSRWVKGTPAGRKVPEVRGTKALHVIDRPDAPQSTIYMGVPAPSPSHDEFIKFSLMNTVLGGAFGSRITTNIREDKGYTYSPRSFIWNRFKTGYWVERADVTTEFTGASLKEIFYEIGRLQDEPLTGEELQALKNYVIGIHVLRNSSRSGVINQIEMANYHELAEDSLDKYVNNVLAVTAADIQAMAKNYLLREKMTIVVVGDEAKITTQIEPYAD